MPLWGLAVVNTPAKTSAKPTDIQQLDALTGGAFTAPTSGERAARVRDWLATGPSLEAMQDVFRELSHRDKGAAKPLKECLDDLKRAKAQAGIAEEWAAKATALLSQPRLNLADAMAWQRDAAKAGAPLSKEPLAALKQALADRMKALEDLQHRVQVERESAVLLAQRIEVLSTKPIKEAMAALDTLRADVAQWHTQAQVLASEPAWDSLDPRYPTQLEASRAQLAVVWEAFEAALGVAAMALEQVDAPLPAVPVWADELRVLRGVAEPVAAAVADAPEPATRKAAAVADPDGALRRQADALREELVAKAIALTQAPEGQRPGGRKIQEALRQLREQWKAVDKGGFPNHALWKRFDEACNQAHKLVEAWLGKLKEHNEANRAQRLALIAVVRDWIAAHADNQDWKAQSRELHAFSEQWRQAGHLSEKLFAELQPQWKQVMHEAHAPLEAAQAASLARRQALIAEAQALGEAPTLRIDAVKALQQRWQQEAQSVPLDRKQEQKLWEAFRQPIDAAFERKGSERDRANTASLSDHDRAVLEAAQALDAASQSGDAQAIRTAMAALQAAARGAAPVAPAAADTPSENPTEAAPDAPVAPAVPKAAAERKLVAVRGDDRPGMVKAAPTQPTGRGGPAGRRDGHGARDGRDPRFGPREGYEPRGPRLGDVAFRAQRDAMERADMAVRKLAAQAHGEVLTQLMGAWTARDGAGVPAAQALGGKAGASARGLWVQALGAAPQAPAAADKALLRLEIAADLPTPAEQLAARRLLQLELLTRRHDAAPVDTWVADVAQVLAGPAEPANQRRLMAVLKALLRR
jgi:hypothetical protein